MQRPMLRRIMRSTCYLAILLQAGACTKPNNANLLDGCYYLGDEPILRIQGVQGILLIQGDVSRFQLIPQASSDYVWMTARPNFVIGGDGRKYVKSGRETASPVILIESEAPASARIFVQSNGEVAKLARRGSCVSK